MALLDAGVPKVILTNRTASRADNLARELGGDISGRNVELVPDKRVVQAWRSNAWPEGVYSIVRFELTPEGRGTRLLFDQAGHPEGAQEMLEGGWHKMYWEPMGAILAGLSA